MNPAPAAGPSPVSAALPRAVVRPPWPDELARVLGAFPEFSRAMPCHPLLLVAGEAPERIVGAASLSEPDSRGVAGLSFVARPRWLDADSCRPLLAGIETTARRLGARRILTADDRAESHPVVPVLRNLGFSDHRQIELWSTDLSALQARTTRLEARRTRAGRSSSPVAQPLAPEHLPAVRELLAAEPFLAPEEITIKGMKDGRGFDPRYSFVVYEGDTLAGVVLVRRVAREAVFVDSLAVAPGRRGGSGLVCHRLGGALVAPGLADGIKTLFYTLDAGAAPGVRRLARRTESQLKRTVLRLVRELA